MPPLQWHHNKRDGVPKHRILDCLLNPSFRRRSKKKSKLRVTGFCEGNPRVTGGFPSQKSSNAEKFPFVDTIMSLSTWYQRGYVRDIVKKKHLSCWWVAHTFESCLASQTNTYVWHHMPKNFPVRKSQDYAYITWHYQVLGSQKCFFFNKKTSLETNLKIHTAKPDDFSPLSLPDRRVVNWNSSPLYRNIWINLKQHGTQYTKKAWNTPTD